MLTDMFTQSPTLALLMFGLAATVAPQAAPRSSAEVARLTDFVGEWVAQVSFPGAPPITGRSTMRLFDGGAWIVEDFEAEMQGAPFRGHGLFGWDATRGVYASVWVDNMEGKLATSSGTWDEKAGAFVLRSDMGKPGAPMPARLTWKFEGKDAFTFTIAPDEDGAEPMMSIRYTRK